ncbi:MAG: hypothetical protein QNJ65_20615 [Xenococcaceae cyanobacterium MO_234.B1]|nr:hypothetical protein [Xenococcaceae cyanobacterium MO_234.B1]
MNRLLNRGDLPSAALRGLSEASALRDRFGNTVGSIFKIGLRTHHQK